MIRLWKETILSGIRGLKPGVELYYSGELKMKIPTGICN
jgi:hypothetical protein